MFPTFLCTWGYTPGPRPISLSLPLHNTAKAERESRPHHVKRSSKPGFHKYGPLAAPLQLLSLPEQLCIPVAGVALPSPQLFRYTSLQVCSRLVGVGTALIIHLGTSCQLLEKLPHTWKYVTVILRQTFTLACAVQKASPCSPLSL